MIDVELEDKVLAALEARARLRGMSLEAFLAELATYEPAPSRTWISGDKAVALIEAEAGTGNPDYSGTYSREDICFDHD